MRASSGLGLCITEPAAFWDSSPHDASTVICSEVKSAVADGVPDVFVAPLRL
jgi:hypothetical protein